MEAVAGNRINRMFQDKGKDILSVFFTAGHPGLEDTGRIILSLQEAGADLIEVGMPFSDPIADGPTIQASSDIALKNGMNMKLLFEQLEAISGKVEIPLILMGYLNPVLQYGIEQFCRDAERVGVSGLILPDLPMHEFESTYRPLFEKHGLVNIFLITPQTSEERIKKIDQLSDSFIYMVSTASTTGAKDVVQDGQVEYFERVRDMHLKNPKLIGFGISNNETFRNACKYSNGAIIGSAFIKSLDSGSDLDGVIKTFIKNIRG